MVKSKTIAGVFLATIMLVGMTGAAQRAIKVTPAGAGDVEKRLALLIGNSDYESSPLANPVNDVRAMEKVLTRLGFTVIKKENADWEEINQAVDRFGEQLMAGGVGLFYYAGHGLQVGGKNYLIPVGSGIRNEKQVRYRALDVGLVLAAMDNARNRLNIVILDACRDNPFVRSFRSTAQGLAFIDAPVGSIIAYSTSPGRTAADGEGQNSLYTAELVRQMQVGGLEIEDVFKRVRRTVRRASDGAQVPWESTSLEGVFHFTPPPGKTSVQPVDVPQPAPAPLPETPGKRKFRVSSETFHTICIEPGGFRMGSDQGDFREKPTHKVTLTRPFYMGQTEVTQGLWQAVMGNNPSRFKDCGFNCPVERVSYEDVRTFLQRLNQQVTGVTFGLPTEAEWEYAARAGTATRYHFGRQVNNLGHYAWFEGNSKGKTHAVAGKKPNDWGLYDMHGNVWEWVEDWYGKYPEASAVDPLGPSVGLQRAIRGGGWLDDAVYVRSSFRSKRRSGARLIFLGFRLRHY